MNVAAIFGALMIVTALSYTPMIIAIIIQKILDPGYTISLFVVTIGRAFYFLSYVVNPVVQSYFRKDLKAFLAKPGLQQKL